MLFRSQHSGQPARIETWSDPASSCLFNGFFPAVRATVAATSMRPRFLGYSVFEKRAGDQMEAMLRERVPTAVLAEMILAEAARIRDGDIGLLFDKLMPLDPGLYILGDQE